jgi:aminopeptidase-like protein
MKLINIIKKLYPFDYSIAGQGNDIAIKEFMKLLQFKIHSFKSGLKHNGWKIPHSWQLKKGLIKD